VCPPAHGGGVEHDDLSVLGSGWGRNDLPRPPNFIRLYIGYPPIYHVTEVPVYGVLPIFLLSMFAPAQGV